ncbi:hypothetical protein RIF29_16211 [Crotalaria pallida]|uniref:Uncharacterized protein n=1 Tax=Crotalaria pallida TaxID=3830 RepID=A0AAN9FG77_CROPI
MDFEVAATIFFVSYSSLTFLTTTLVCRRKDIRSLTLGPNIDLMDKGTDLLREDDALDPMATVILLLL